MFTWLVLAACTDWGSALPAPNTPPVAVAETVGGATIALGETAMLSGAGSTDPDGLIVGWQWSVVEAPPESSAGIAGAQAAEASFTPDVAGSYTLSLRVWDERGEVSAADVAAVIAEEGASSGADSGSMDTDADSGGADTDADSGGADSGDTAVGADSGDMDSGGTSE